MRCKRISLIDETPEMFLFSRAKVKPSQRKINDEMAVVKIALK